MCLGDSVCSLKNYLVDAHKYSLMKTEHPITGVVIRIFYMVGKKYEQKELGSLGSALMW